MESSGNTVNNWHAAGARLRDLEEVCEAFIRGDQPEKTERLGLADIARLYTQVAEVLEFCLASMQAGYRLTPGDGSVYVHAMQYRRSLGRVLQHHPDITSDPGLRSALDKWFAEAPSLPKLTYTYV